MQWYDTPYTSPLPRPIVLLTDIQQDSQDEDNEPPSQKNR